MAKAFTEQEADIILQNLKTSARRYAASRGVRKTTVDELAREAGISKGAFYKFYPSKEMLFFEILEDMHTEIYAAFLLRKIPAEVQEKHYHSDEVHIKELFSNAELEPDGGMELAAAVVRSLFLTVSHRDNIGPLYPQVLDTLVRGACQHLFPEN